MEILPNGEECAVNYYPESDIMCCAQHQDAKRLANKMYTRWSTASYRLAAFIKDEIFHERKMEGLLQKIDKTWQEFTNCERGIDRCCGYKTRKI